MLKMALRRFILFNSSSYSDDCVHSVHTSTQNTNGVHVNINFCFNLKIITFKCRGFHDATLSHYL